MIKDGQAALKWLHDHASEFNVDASRIVAFGHSRGGFIVNYAFWNKRFANRYLAGAILENGIGPRNVEQAHKDHKPLLVISSKDDPTVKFMYSEELVDKLDGTDVSFVIYTNAKHFPMRKMGSFFEEIDTFLTNLEDEPAPGVGDASDPWPQVAEDNSKCFEEGSKGIIGLDLLGCQTKAIEAGHRYYQWNADAHVCATTDSCKSTIRLCLNPNKACDSKWQIFWSPLHGRESANAPTNPTAPTDPPASSDPNCKSFCYRNTKEWSLKCKWNECSACSDCSTATINPNCKPFCYKNTKGWSLKCKWDECSACSEC
jgi:predicted alpha/beta hydrolase family esterase